MWPTILKNNRSSHHRQERDSHSQWNVKFFAPHICKHRVSQNQQGMSSDKTKCVFWSTHTYFIICACPITIHKIVTDSRRENRKEAKGTTAFSTGTSLSKVSTVNCTTLVHFKSSLECKTVPNFKSVWLLHWCHFQYHKSIVPWSKHAPKNPSSTQNYENFRDFR